MKDYILGVCGIIGAVVASWFGGWTSVMTTLLVFMGIDYLTGILVAGVFHASPKTDDGTLESRAGWKGLIRKGVTLLIVLISARIDLLLDTTYFRDGVCIAFIVNELLSIIENAGLMGVPIPEVIRKGIELLKQKTED